MDRIFRYAQNVETCFHCKMYIGLDQQFKKYIYTGFFRKIKSNTHIKVGFN